MISVKNNTLSVVSMPKLVHVLPGTNVISESAWEAFKATKIGQILIEEKKLELVDTGLDEKATLLKMSPAKAVALVKEIFNVQQLETWESEETRYPVKVAIQNRIKTIFEKSQPSKTEE